MCMVVYSSICTDLYTDILQITKIKEDETVV